MTKWTRAEQVAWAAGLFEGEGTITVSGNRRYISVTNTDLSVLEKFSEIIPWGTVYGPYQQSGKRKLFWRWMAWEEDAFDALAVLGPYLGERRLTRAYDLTGIRFDQTHAQREEIESAIHC